MQDTHQPVAGRWSVVETDDPQLHPTQSARLRRYAISHLVDLHCHCLPGLDDGPGTMDQALALCGALVADGITAVVATPHQLGRYEGASDGQLVRDTVSKLRDQLSGAGIPLDVAAGAVVRLDERLPQLLASDQVLALPDGGDHLLLELPRSIYIEPAPLIRAMYVRGMSVIISEPERNGHATRHPERLVRWIREGASIQINAGSLCGEYGQVSEQAAWHWLSTGVATLVATGAHGSHYRPPRMSQALQLIEQRLGLDVARAVCLENPMRVVFQRGSVEPRMASGSADR